MCTQFLLTLWFIPAVYVFNVMDMNCLLCHMKLVLPVKFHACIRSKSIPTELISSLVTSCICPKNVCIAASVDLAHFTVLSVHTKYINLSHFSLFWTSISKRYLCIFLYVV
jgi:TPP-dependent 2-oxoacid decarboxylase